MDNSETVKLAIEKANRKKDMIYKENTKKNKHMQKPNIKQMKKRKKKQDKQHRKETKCNELVNITNI